MNRNIGAKPFAFMAAIVLLISWLRLEPGNNAQGVSAGPGGGDVAAEEVTGDGDLAGSGAVDPNNPAGASSSSQGGTTGGTTKTGADPSSFNCGAGNGGATDVGVTATRIKPAT